MSAKPQNVLHINTFHLSTMFNMLLQVIIKLYESPLSFQRWIHSADAPRIWTMPLLHKSVCNCSSPDFPTSQLCWPTFFPFVHVWFASLHYDNKNTDMIIIPEQLEISHVVSWSSRSPSIIELHWRSPEGRRATSWPALRPKVHPPLSIMRPHGLSSQSRTHEMHVVAKSRANNEECA